MHIIWTNLWTSNKFLEHQANHYSSLTVIWSKCQGFESSVHFECPWKLSEVEQPFTQCCEVTIPVFSLLCGRIHLQRRIEDEEQCLLLARELQGLIQQAFTQHIHDREVLQEDYIRRVLHLRKVKPLDTLNIVWVLDCLWGDDSQSEDYKIDYCQWSIWLMDTRPATISRRHWWRWWWNSSKQV